MRSGGSRKLSSGYPGSSPPVLQLRESGAVRAAYHIAIDMLESCCPEAAAILEEAEPDALAYLDFPSSHWKRLRTNNVQERTNRETRRRSRVVQVFPSTASPERLAGAVMCDMDEGWARSRYFSEKSMVELYEERTGEERLAAEREAGFQLVARRAIEATLELADMLEAA